MLATYLPVEYIIPTRNRHTAVPAVRRRRVNIGEGPKVVFVAVIVVQDT